MKLYLAGPMRGYPRFNFDAFETAYLDLTYRGHDVTSPHRMDLNEGFDPDVADPESIPPQFVEECVRRDVEAIIQNEGVIFLPGWHVSDGAKAEWHIAQWLPRPRYSYPDFTPATLFQPDSQPWTQ